MTLIIFTSFQPTSDKTVTESTTMVQLISLHESKVSLKLDKNLDLCVKAALSKK